jgi:hypothetical protein
MVQVLAVLCSDIHRSHTPPVFRATEPDWYAAMNRPLIQVVDAANKHGVPLVIAGDIFDRWGSPAATINSTMEILKSVTAGCFAVPGQHDLANHLYSDIRLTAYWTLVESGVVMNLEPGYPRHVYIEDDGQGYELAMYGFPWGFPVEPLNRPERVKTDPPIVYLAVVHQYVWIDQNTSYPGAPDEGKVGGLKKRLKGFDAAVFGDNHIGFSATVGDTSVINCGTFLIRKSDEIGYRPRYGLLMSDGSIVVKYLRVSEDLYADQEIITENEVNPRVRKALAEEMNALGSESLNFRDALDWFMDKAKTDRSVRSIVYACLG